MNISSLEGHWSSMSDLDLMRGAEPASRGPEYCSPPTPRMELLSPSKVKHRSQNVTEKFTQVWGSNAPTGSVCHHLCARNPTKDL